MRNTQRVRPWALGIAGLTGLAIAAWWCTDEAPYPYSNRAILNLPLPFLTSTNLEKILQPRQSERILEVGPGTGLQSLHVASLLGEHGRLDVVDSQRDMIDHVIRRAQRRGISNIAATLGDARSLPFEDGAFDAAYLVTVLGEIPAPDRVLAELARVLSPQGRLVVGEFLDPHWVSLKRLVRLALGSGLKLQVKRGSTFAYLARFCHAEVYR